MRRRVLNLLNRAISLWDYATNDIGNYQRKTENKDDLKGENLSKLKEWDIRGKKSRSVREIAFLFRYNHWKERQFVHNGSSVVPLHRKWGFQPNRHKISKVALYLFSFVCGKRPQRQWQGQLEGLCYFRRCYEKKLKLMVLHAWSTI
jgi:hypothetical protein